MPPPVVHDGHKPFTPETWVTKSLDGQLRPPFGLHPRTFFALFNFHEQPPPHSEVFRM
jgi:hypothetical protein